MTFLANIAKVDVAATTRYILVDKSDITNYPHANATRLCIEKISYSILKEGTGDWNFRVGFVEEVDASNGSVTFFISIPLRGTIYPQGNTITVDYSSLLRKGITIDEKVSVSSEDVDGSTNWQDDVTLARPVGSNVAPAAGDIVIELEEVDGTSTVSFSATAHYSEADEK